MLAAHRIWRQRPCPDDLVSELEHELGIGRLTARILAARGCEAPERANAFLAKRLADCHRPEALRQMDVAAARFARALDHRETILVHGDYDVDGSTATTLISLFCQAMGHHAVAWIPHRRIDGYGLGEASLQAVQDHGASLMITVDCGIADNGWAATIERETGCDVVVTDHHLPQAHLPECLAVVNPNHPECTYPDKGLAGVGVAWKLCWATACRLVGAERLPQGLRDFLLDALALVAVGTVADCAPLDGENRILVHHGLRALATTTNPGLRALCEQARVSRPISASDIGWKIAPLLNASGRLGSAMRNIHLLTATTDDEAKRWLDEVVTENTERRRLSQLLTDDLMAEVLGGDERWNDAAALVFAGEGWHPGVVGIVASRLTERFGKPSAVIAIDEQGEGKGSLRTVPSVHLAHALEACSDTLIKGGGHAMAAGLTIESSRVEDFRQAFDAAVRSQTPAGLPPPGIDHDGTARIGEIDGRFFADLERLGPFGQGNPEPVLHLRDVRFAARPRFFGKGGDHLRGALTDSGGGMRECLAWKARSQFSALVTPGLAFDALVRPQVEWFRGNEQHRLVLIDGNASLG